MKAKKILMLVLILAIAGCSSTAYVIKNANTPNEQNNINMLNEPLDSIGVLLTENIRKGKVTIIPGRFPEDLFGEYYPGKITYKAWVVSPNGEEYFAQGVFSGIDYSGYFVINIIIDEVDSSKINEAKIVITSAKVSSIFDLSGKRYSVVSNLFVKDQNYRKKVILENGTRIGDVVRIPEFLKTVLKWNPYKTSRGKILSPLGDNETKIIAAINPQYSYSEKLIGEGNFTLSPDPVGTSAGIGIDLYRPMTTTDKGWCFECEVATGEELAFIIKFPLELKQRLINKINRSNYQKLKTSYR